MVEVVTCDKHNAERHNMLRFRVMA